jgi:DNA (cytosine-5)-methyltransferase 1
MVFEEVCVDLESQGYTVQPILLAAAGVGAPHRRDRIWFVAYNASYSECFRLQYSEKRGDIQESTGKTRCERSKFTESIEANGGNGSSTYTNSIGYERWKERKSTESKSQPTNKQLERFSQLCRANFEMFPSQSPICGGDDGLPTELDGITFSKWRQESIKGYGNAIVPQVAYEIFKVIAEIDRLEKLQLKLF